MVTKNKSEWCRWYTTTVAIQSTSLFRSFVRFVALVFIVLVYKLTHLFIVIFVVTCRMHTNRAIFYHKVSINTAFARTIRLISFNWCLVFLLSIVFFCPFSFLWYFLFGKKHFIQSDQFSILNRNFCGAYTFARYTLKCLNIWASDEANVSYVL